MFYIWHTLLVLVFIVISFVLGYNYGKKVKNIKLLIQKKQKQNVQWGLINGL